MSARPQLGRRPCEGRCWRCIFGLAMLRTCHPKAGRGKRCSEDFLTASQTCGALSFAVAKFLLWNTPAAADRNPAARPVCPGSRLLCCQRPSCSRQLHRNPGWKRSQVSTIFPLATAPPRASNQIGESAYLATSCVQRLCSPVASTPHLENQPRSPSNCPSLPTARACGVP